MKIALIGGTRFIGVAIVEELVGAGHEVLVVHRGSGERADAPDVPHVHADRRDVAAVGGALAGFRPEAVVDTCAYATADAETALAALPSATRAVVLSSMDTYRAFATLRSRAPATDALPLDESSPVRGLDQRYLFRGDPSAPHAALGIDPETYENLDVEAVYLPAGATVLRLPMVYGERDELRREEFVLRRLRAGRDRIPVGSGTLLWTKGWVRDVARAVRLAAESPDVRGRVLNLGERRTVSVAHWAQQIVAAAGARATLVPVPDDALPEDLLLTAAFPQHVLVDSAAARDALGWTDTDPDEALAASVAWHLAHPPPGPAPDLAADDAALAAA